MQNAFFDLQYKVRRQNLDTMEWMEKTEKEYRAMMAQVTRHNEENKTLLAQITKCGVDNTAILDQLKKQAGDRKELVGRNTKITRDRNIRESKEVHEEDSCFGRSTNKRKIPHSDEPNNEKQVKSSVLEKHQKELQEIDH
ncbi:hypothetical protein Aduo_001643 [Ancylostoma duodenale]